MRNSIFTNPGPAAVTGLAMALVLAASPAHARDAPWVGTTLDGSQCSEFSRQGFGPYDYRNPEHRSNHLDVVEGRHFTEPVRSLRRGETRKYPLGDIDYTIRAFPNHHQALYAMIRYTTSESFADEAEKALKQTSRDGDRITPPECFLQRAEHFAPEDHYVRILSGIFYHRIDAFDKATRAYEEALSLAEDSAEAHYNYGLLLTDMERFSEAREHARRAYEQGYPLEGLRRRLAAAGHPLDD